jgi:hypothetical protein
MAIEWIRVDYPRTRDVFIDKRRSHVTNEILAVGEGTHRVDLGEPVDYQPAKQLVSVTNTSAQSPKVITFTEKA